MGDFNNQDIDFSPGGSFLDDDDHDICDDLKISRKEVTHSGFSRSNNNDMQYKDSS